MKYAKKIACKVMHLFITCIITFNQFMKTSIIYRHIPELIPNQTWSNWN